MKKRVLLVEDHRLSRDSLMYLLRDLGHEVRACASAEEAKTCVADYRPEIALLDIGLPGVRGDRFAEFLAAELPATQIIFVSGEWKLDNLDRFGPQTQFIPKPLDFNKLAHTLQA